MASVDKELEQQLLEAGNRLSLLPTQVDELLPLLDQVNNLLSKVEQSPPKPIQNAYSPSMIALLEEPLLKHSDGDVKVAIASCISEITRITAPEAPYNDDQMKDVFQLIVSSFENLSDKSSRSYNKRASILETVAKVRSCVVMLDLECDGLIVEMFQHFLNSIRDYHPENVFTSMETIMTLVLEESEDVSLELLTTILASVKRDNEEIPTIARKLGEKVFEKCAVKIKPYLAQAVKSLGVSLDDYGKVVASICEGTTGAVEHNDGNGNGEQLAAESKLTFPEEAAQVDDRKLNTASSNDTAQVAKEDVTEEASLKEVCAEAKTSLKSVTSNGMTEIGNEGTLFVPESSEKPDEGNFSSESLDVNLTNKVDTDDSDAGKFAKSESKPEQTVKRRGRKPNSVLNSTETSDSSHLDRDKEAEITCQKTSDKEALKPSQPQKSDSKDSHTSCGEDQHVDTGASSEKKREHETQISSPKALNSVVNVAYLSPSESVPDESVPKKAAWGKKKENLAQEDAPSVDPVPAKVTDETSDLEVKPPRHSEKTKENLAQEDAAPSVVPVSVKVADGEVKPQRRSGKKKGNLAQEDAPSVDPVSVEVVGGTIDLEVKPQRSSGKKKNNLAQEDAPSVDPVLAKVADGTSDSEVKPQRRSGKKATARITKEEKMVTGGGTSKSEGETTSDSVAKPLRESAKKGDASDLEAKPLKQPGKKGETSRPRARGKSLKQSGKKGHDSDSEIKPLGKKDPSNYEDKASSKKNDKKSRGRGKDNREKDLSKSHAKDDDQDMVSSPKLVKDEDRLEEPKTNSKRKRTPGKDVLLSSFDKVSGDIEYEGNLVGSKVKVWWPKDRAFYEGVIHSFYPDTNQHKVLYTDGDEEILVLQKEKWKYIEDETVQEETNEEESSSKTKHKKKKAKTNSEPLPKQKQMDVSPKRGGAAASSKSKGTPTKSVSKVDDRKVDSKSKDKTSKPTDKSTDNLSGDGKSVDDVSRAAIKSKDGGGSMPKISAKSNQETPKAVTKTKGKTPQSGNKSNGTGKVKSSSSKVKEADNSKGKSSDSGKTPDTVKGKSPEISKAQESEAKSGKKRRRGFKG